MKLNLLRLEQQHRIIVAQIAPVAPYVFVGPPFEADSNIRHTGLASKDALAQFDFNQVEPTTQGFRAIRPLPKDWSPDRWR